MESDENLCKNYSQRQNIVAVFIARDLFIKITCIIWQCLLPYNACDSLSNSALPLQS